MIRYRSRFQVALRELATALERSWYPELVAELFGPESIRALRMTSAEEVALSDAVAERSPHARHLVALCLLEESVRKSDLVPCLPAAALGDLVDLGLLVEDGSRLRMDAFRIVPFGGLLLIASPLVLAAEPDGAPGRRIPTAYLGQDSAELCRVLQGWRPARPDARVLDLCTGTGVAALTVAARRGVCVLGTDVEPQALAVAQANAALNGLEDRASFAASDLYQALGEARFDLILANPPYIPCPPDLGYPRWGWGGPDGLALVRPIPSGSAPAPSTGGSVASGAQCLRRAGRTRAGRVVERAGCRDGVRVPDLAAPDAGQAAGWRRVSRPGRGGDARRTVPRRGRSAIRRRAISQALPFPRPGPRGTWGLLRLDTAGTSHEVTTLFSTLDGDSVLALEPGYRLEFERRQLGRLLDPDGQLLTLVPTNEVAQLSAFDGCRSVAEIGALAADWPVARCIELARTVPARGRSAPGRSQARHQGRLDDGTRF